MTSGRGAGASGCSDRPEHHSEGERQTTEWNEERAEDQRGDGVDELAVALPNQLLVESRFVRCAEPAALSTSAQCGTDATIAQYDTGDDRGLADRDRPLFEAMADEHSSNTG